MYEYWANHPQSLHQMTILMSDRGIPRSWRHMHGFGSHTLGLWNHAGERVWVKWHLKTDQGIQCVSDEEAATLSPHGAQQDLVQSIERGEFPSWTVQLQILTEEAARRFPVNPFDLTKVWPHTLAPLRNIGTLKLNRNVDNFFAETEQAAFAPSNLVPGISASPDKMLQARLIAYQDAQRYRIGVNHNQLPVNAPRCPVHHNQRDGAMATGGSNQGSGVNFYPNDRDDMPKPNLDFAPPPLRLLEDASVGAYDQDDEDYFEQAGDLYRVMSDQQQSQLAATIAGGLAQANRSVQERMLDYLHRADADYCQRVRDAIEALG